jgi:hypothetical protein
VSPPTIPRLPLGPLLPYLQPEIDAINERNRRPGELTAAAKAGPPAAIESLLGCRRRKAQRITITGEINERDADHIAIRLGYHPALIWGTAWWDLARDLEAAA